MIHYRCGGTLIHETHHVRGWVKLNGDRIAPSTSPEPDVFRCDNCGLAGIPGIPEKRRVKPKLWDYR